MLYGGAVGWAANILSERLGGSRSARPIHAGGASQVHGNVISIDTEARTVVGRCAHFTPVYIDRCHVAAIALVSFCIMNMFSICKTYVHAVVYG